MILHHQDICSDVKSVNDCMSLGISIGNQNICLQICVYLYCADEIGNKFIKLAFFGLLLCLCSILLLYCNYGQKICNQGDEIRNSLSKCSWLDKPLWFKKNIIIMMSRANVPIEIKPFGLYVLNLNNFTSVMNGAYSLFNLLNFKK